jgi:hypothetical protein
MTSSNDTLHTVWIRTTLDEWYTIPGVHAVARAILSRPLDQSRLTIANVTGACLVVPTRVISKIYMDQTLIWEAPNAGMSELQETRSGH